MIKYLVGDASKPDMSHGKPVIIAHIVNDVGAWGSGFVIAVSNRWPDIRDAYIQWCHDPVGGFRLGATMLMQTDTNDISVANMVAQHNINSRTDVVPIRYEHLVSCLEYLAYAATYEFHEKAVVVMPRIGCGRAGGSWKVIEPLIEHYLCHQGIEVQVYDLEIPETQFASAS